MGAALPQPLFVHSALMRSLSRKSTGLISKEKTDYQQCNVFARSVDCRQSVFLSIMRREL